MPRLFPVSRSLSILRRAGVVLALATTVGCSGDVVTPSTASIPSSLLVYGLGDSAQMQGGSMNSGLRAIRPNGADDRPYLGASPWGYVYDIVASPGGSHLAVAQGRVGGSLIIIDALGQMRAVNFDSTGLEFPSSLGWSPDGRFLAYHRSSGFGVTGLDIVTLGGDVVDVRERLAGGLACDGSADSSKLDLDLWRWLTLDRVEFVWNRCAEPDRTFHISADGSDLEEIIPATRSMGWLSPSGSRVLYPAPNFTPMVAMADGSDARPLSTTGGSYFWDFFRRMVSPWSPDGTHVILSHREENCDEQPYVLSIDGSREGPMASGEGCWEFHSWSPDGKWIAATRLDAGPGAVIYLFSRDGTERAELVVGTDSQFVMDVAWIQAP